MQVWHYSTGSGSRARPIRSFTIEVDGERGDWRVAMRAIERRHYRGIRVNDLYQPVEVSA